MSKSYIDPETQKHYEFKEDRRFVGTPRYASINTHCGIRQSRRDDLESIVYVLIYFLIGELPWQGLKAKTKSDKKEKIKLKKMNVVPKEMCGQIPLEFAEMLEYTKKLTFAENPKIDLK